MLMQSCDGDGALAGVACGEDEVEGFRRWADREEFIDEAAADSEPEAAERWGCSAPIVLGNLKSKHGRKDMYTCWLLL